MRSLTKDWRKDGFRNVLWLWLSALPFQVVSLWPQDGCSSSKYHVLAHWLLRGRRRNSSLPDITYMKESLPGALQCIPFTALWLELQHRPASPIWLGTWKCSDWLMWTEIRFPWDGGGALSSVLSHTEGWYSNSQEEGRQDGRMDSGLCQRVSDSSSTC